MASDNLRDGDKVVAYGQWVMVYRSGVGYIALHSAPMLGINELAAGPWLRALESNQTDKES